MAKKIAIITERADVGLGGAERSVFELSSALQQLGWQADILAATGQTEGRNVHILCGNRRGRRVCYFSFAKELKKYLAKNVYEIIHHHGQSTDMSFITE